MTSEFKQTKILIDNIFQDNWCSTPVHFVGEEFNSDDIPKWINPFYEPSYGNLADICGRTNNYGNLHVACWAKTNLDSMELADQVISLVDTQLDKNTYRVRRFEVSDQGWNESNDTYTVVTFSIEMLVN